MKDLVGGPHTNLMAMHTMLINKPPDTGESLFDDRVPSWSEQSSAVGGVF